MREYKRFEGETEEELIYRVCSDKEAIGTWNDVADILNNLLGYKYTESRYRKQWQGFQRLLSANQAKFVSDEKQLDEIRRERWEKEELLKQIQTEKLEYNRWLRELGRDKMIADKIANAVRENFVVEAPLPLPEAAPSADKVGVLMFGDEHYGTIFEIKGLMGEVINSYSPEIFEKRMWELYEQTLEIVRKENLQKLYVFSMGDFSDGILRVKQLFRLRYGLIEGSTRYAKFITVWLNELSKSVKIEFQTVSGNHTEPRYLGQPKGTFDNDNADIIVRTMVSVCLEDNPNFTYVENPTGMIYSEILGYTFVGIHGETKSMASELENLSGIYGKRIDYLIGGHLHHETSEVVGINREAIRVPSIMGIDNYALSLNKVAHAGALLIIIQKDYGIKCKYPIKFSE